jgi:hypothetical protein
LNIVLQPGASCSLSISFAPQAPGTRSATLTLNGGVGVALSLGVRGDARVGDGEDCPGQVNLCESGSCTEWYPDPDGDGFGSLEAVGGFPVKNVCGTRAARPPAPFVFVGGCRGVDVEIPYVLRNNALGIANAGLDCCDRFFECDTSGGTTVTPDNAFPGQTVGSSGILGCGTSGAGLARDYDCDGEAVLVPSSVSPPLSCDGRAEADCLNGAGRTTEPDCAASTTTYTSRGCTFSGGECVLNPAGAGQNTALCL